ncbi:MAG TPA: DUF2206 domain-containing protein [Candidatus Saccharimonadales bacterium]|nr:DUF2206 domain-containing protein [Candidatus Saccharimonadales bacterium]
MLLAIADMALLTGSAPLSLFTVAFFLFAPGYLVLRRVPIRFSSRWEVAVFSLALSILLLMATGLAVNGLHALGVDRPLSVGVVLPALNALVLGLTLLNRKERVAIPDRVRLPNSKMLILGVAVSFLPLLSAAGAIRLNNGGSSVLTMILFAAIPIIIGGLLLPRNDKMKSIYTYVIFCISLALLFSNSLRSWLLSGHDIHRELSAFMGTNSNAFWNITSSSGNPYNACLSITLLPTLLSKISNIADPYVFKLLFQAIFALVVVQSYLFAKRIIGHRLALVAAFATVAFPAFLNDMPFLNRQEIAGLFFAVLISTLMLGATQRVKKTIAILAVAGIILSHYSTSYVTIMILLFAWIAYKLVTLKGANKPRSPYLFTLPFIAIALLGTFWWNTQITQTTGGLKQTLTKTVNGILHGSDEHGEFLRYSPFAPEPLTKSQEFAQQTEDDSARGFNLVDNPRLEMTPLGDAVSRVIDVGRIHDTMHVLSAQAYQLFLMGGAVIVYIQYRRKRKDTYFYLFVFSVAGIGALATVTLLPRLSVDYDVIRLFQQSLIVTAPAMVVGLAYLFARFKRYAALLAASCFMVIFLHLSGFLPQLTGKFQPQQALNNSGPYYDFFYQHSSDKIASQWVADHAHDKQTFMDTDAAIRPVKLDLTVGFLSDSVLRESNDGYLYRDNMNVASGHYRAFMKSGLTLYDAPSLAGGRSQIYSNSGSEIYAPRY